MNDKIDFLISSSKHFYKAFFTFTIRSEIEIFSYVAAGFLKTARFYVKVAAKSAFFLKDGPVLS